MTMVYVDCMLTNQYVKENLSPLQSKQVNVQHLTLDSYTCTYVVMRDTY